MAAKNEMFSREQLEGALTRAGGNIKKAAEDLGCDRGTFYKRMKRFPSLKRFIARERQFKKQTRLDIAESNLDFHLAMASWNATKYVLDTLGQKRGYGRKIELSGNEKKPVGVLVDSSEWQKRKQKQAEKAGVKLTK